MKKSLIIMIVLIILIFTGYFIISNKDEAILKEYEIQAEVKTVELSDNEHMHVELDINNEKVPVPNGYVGSSVDDERQINTGYVIYEGTEAVTSENVEEARKTRNQYVWVPVPEPSKMYGIDSNGKMWGKLYNFSATSGDEITGTSANNWSESNGVMKINSNTGNREPDVLKDCDMDSTLVTLNLGIKTMNEFEMQLEKEFYAGIKRIEKYGGFYIGRYETGGLNGRAKIVKGDTNINSQTWYTMYKKCKELKGANQNVNTGMIWGCEQDRVLMWLMESGNKTKEQIAKDSKDWGNYPYVALEYVNSSGNIVKKPYVSNLRIPSGASEYTKANNIYDLAGNVSDLGMEAYSNNRRFYRGGNYNYSSSDYPASRRSFVVPTYSSDYIGCRATLYIR